MFSNCNPWQQKEGRGGKMILLGKWLEKFGKIEVAECRKVEVRRNIEFRRLLRAILHHRREAFLQELKNPIKFPSSNLR